MARHAGATTMAPPDQELQQQQQGGGGGAGATHHGGGYGSTGPSRAAGPPRPMGTGGAPPPINTSSREMRPGMQQWLRIRSDSCGSTRGAFVQHDNAKTGGPQQHPIAPRGDGGGHPTRKKGGKSAATATGLGQRSGSGDEEAVAAMSSLDDGLGLGTGVAADPSDPNGPAGGMYSPLQGQGHGHGHQAPRRGSAREAFTSHPQPSPPQPPTHHHRQHPQDATQHHTPQVRTAFAAERSQSDNSASVFGNLSASRDYTPNRPSRSTTAATTGTTDSSGATKSAYDPMGSLEYSSQNLLSSGNMSMNMSGMQQMERGRSSVQGTAFLWDPSLTSMGDIENRPSGDSNENASGSGGGGSGNYGSMVGGGGRGTGNSNNASGGGMMHGYPQPPPPPPPGMNQYHGSFAPQQLQEQYHQRQPPPPPHTYGAMTPPGTGYQMQDPYHHRQQHQQQQPHPPYHHQQQQQQQQQPYQPPPPVTDAMALTEHHRNPQHQRNEEPHSHHDSTRMNEIMNFSAYAQNGYQQQHPTGDDHQDIDDDDSLSDDDDDYKYKFGRKDRGTTSFGQSLAGIGHAITTKVRGLFGTGHSQPGGDEDMQGQQKHPVATISYDEYGNTILPPQQPEEEEHVGYFTFAYRSLLYDKYNPEFTSLQQFSWAVLLGVFMGILTAYWGKFIEGCIDVVWKDVPEQLMKAGLFTERDGRFPLVHYMWICPAIFGGILSYVTAKLPVPIPGQNEWIESLHRQGVLDPATFWYILVISTGGMASGLSLGPELPLVLLAGMVGSYLGMLTQQSVLSARVMNLTAASAAIGGFFGFPMAGALFVLEIPHRMGLQYFEALSPATISSIVSVLVNRICTGNDVKGYFDYPFLSATLPSHIFYIAILYGIIGSVIGTFYAEGCLKIKTVTHDLFHYHEHNDDAHPAHVSNGDTDDHDDLSGGISSENLPLVGSAGGARNSVGRRGRVPSRLKLLWDRIASFGIQQEPQRAAVVGTIAGIVTGVVCMFLPHSLFWGEAQLQTLIDNGRTRLPVFYSEEGGNMETTDLVQYGYCMVEPKNAEDGFSIGCSAVLLVAKVFVIGLSLGTGIVGGHFWGPLYVGATGANLFVKLMEAIHDWLGLGAASKFDILFAHPCVALLCIMGSAHVVIFRAHTAIMLILTLTITAFNTEDGTYTGGTGGDYSAVFPLLVVSCFVSLMMTRSTVFYKQQRCRGDIIAAPEVLCEPGKMGQPEYPMHQEADESRTDSFYDEDDPDGLLDTSWGEQSDGEGLSMGSVSADTASHDSIPPKTVQSKMTPADIERDFARMQQSNGQAPAQQHPSAEHDDHTDEDGSRTGVPDADSPRDASVKNESQSTPPTVECSPTSVESGAPPRCPVSNIDEILAAPIETIKNRRKNGRSAKKHRRIQSGSDVISLSAKEKPLREDKARLRACSFDRGDAGSVRSGGGHSRTSSMNSNRARANSRDRSNASTPTHAILTKVNSFGELGEFQPDLMSQARMRASSVVRNPTPPMVPKMGHTRKSSASGSYLSGQIGGDVAGAISQEDIERAFSSVQNQANLESDSQLLSKVNVVVRRRVGTDPRG